MAQDAHHEPDGEEILLARSRAGDKAAFGTLAQRYYPFAVGVAYRMTGNSQLAEDLVQEAFIKAWRKLPQFRGDCRFRVWLGRIVANTTLDYLRRQNLEQPLDEAVLPALPAEDVPLHRLEREELRQWVRQAVLSLPAQCRIALILREYEDLSYREISETLGIPMGTVMSRLHYARQLLREKLAPLLELPEHTAGGIREDASDPR
ncbi:MAG: RNA polymerase sigma factor [Anaerolineae bacterium]